MELTIHFVAGQVIMAVGAYLLYKFAGGYVAFGVWCLLEGAVSVLYGLLAGHGAEKPSKEWHE